LQTWAIYFVSPSQLAQDSAGVHTVTALAGPWFNCIVANGSIGSYIIS